MSACRACRASILWAKTPTGKAIPVDASPVASGGNIALLNVGGAVVASVLDKQGRAALPSLQPSPDAPLYVSHFVTCPEAAMFRRNVERVRRG